jgi:hypothetical protein
MKRALLAGCLILAAAAAQAQLSAPPGYYLIYSATLHGQEVGRYAIVTQAPTLPRCEELKRQMQSHPPVYGIRPPYTLQLECVSLAWWLRNTREEPARRFPAE